MSGDSGAVCNNRSATAAVTYRDWCEALERGTLLGVECETCTYVSATPKRVCPNCSGRTVVGLSLPLEGKVHSETTITVPPAEFEGPYTVAVVDLGPARLLARVEGDASIGDAVEFAGTIERAGAPGPVFEPTG